MRRNSDHRAAAEDEDMAVRVTPQKGQGPQSGAVVDLVNAKNERCQELGTVAGANWRGDVDTILRRGGWRPDGAWYRSADGSVVVRVERTGK